jgi:hypothetical protein
MHKQLIFVVLSMSSIALWGMNAPAENENIFDALPKDLCALIAKDLPQPSYEHTEHNRHLSESCCMSLTWNTIAWTRENLFDHQVWWQKEYGGRYRFRFDNDTIADANVIMKSNLRDSLLITTKYDGPNHDGGEHHGVAVIGYTAELDKKKQTVLSLFKLHGTSVQEYKGAQFKQKMNLFPEPRLIYDDFPYESQPFVDEALDYCAIAPRGRCALATTGEKSKEHLLRIFSYAAKTFLDRVPDQEFEVKEVASSNSVPLFKKLCWLYGRNLLGVSSDNKLYLLAPHEGKISCYLQKIPFAVKNIALNNPHKQHEVILCDTDDALYYANLGQRNANGSFAYRCIYKNGINLDQMILNEKQEKPMIQGPIDRLWAFKDKLCAMNLSSATCCFISPLGNHKKSTQLAAINAWARDASKNKPQ